MISICPSDYEAVHNKDFNVGFFSETISKICWNLHEDNFTWPLHFFIPMSLTLFKVHGHSSVGKVKMSCFSWQVLV